MFKGTAIGNVTKDPVERKVGNNTISVVSVAVNRKTNGVNETTFINVTFWNKLSEISQRFIKKGVKIAVSGELYTKNYTTKDGRNGSSLEMNADSLELLTFKTDSAQSRPATNSAPNVSSNEQTEADDDDLPF